MCKIQVENNILHSLKAPSVVAPASNEHLLVPSNFVPITCTPRGEGLCAAMDAMIVAMKEKQQWKSGQDWDPGDGCSSTVASFFRQSMSISFAKAAEQPSFVTEGTSSAGVSSQVSKDTKEKGCGEKGEHW